MEESSSASVSLMLVSDGRAVKESSRNKECSTEVTELRLSILCLFLARVASGSSSRRGSSKGDEV